MRDPFGIVRGVDYVVVISGEIDLMLDDSIVHLRAGDTIVQQATNRAPIGEYASPDGARRC
jgi:hypothetical protein